MSLLTSAATRFMGRDGVRGRPASWKGETSNDWTRIGAMNRSAGMLPAYSLPESRTIDSDQSRLIGRQRFKPAASRRSVLRFMGSFLFFRDLLTGLEPPENSHGWQSRPTDSDLIHASFPIRGSALPSVGYNRYSVNGKFSRYWGRAVGFPVHTIERLEARGKVPVPLTLCRRSFT